ncbi:hypothetical protein BH23ACT6_BH23ACT6_12990 [soil metagenome]
MTGRNAQTLTLQVQGMNCAGCERRMGSALRRPDGLVEAAPDHASGQVRVRFDPARTDRGAVLDRIVLAGFTVEDADTDTDTDTDTDVMGVR